MPPKRSSIGRSTSKARKRKIERSQESPEARQARLESRRQMALRSQEQSLERLSQLGDRSHNAPQNSQDLPELNNSQRVEPRPPQMINWHMSAFSYDPTIDYKSHRQVYIGKISTSHVPPNFFDAISHFLPYF